MSSLASVERRYPGTTRRLQNRANYSHSVWVGGGGVQDICDLASHAMTLHIHLLYLQHSWGFFPSKDSRAPTDMTSSLALILNYILYLMQPWLCAFTPSPCLLSVSSESAWDPVHKLFSKWSFCVDAEVISFFFCMCAYRCIQENGKISSKGVNRHKAWRN